MTDQKVEKRGPSLAGKIIGPVSVLIALVAICIPATSSWGTFAIFVGLLVWLLWFAPRWFDKLSTNPHATFLCDTDWMTGFWGGVSWVVIYGLLDSALKFGENVGGLPYPHGGYWLGLALAVYTSVIVGKMARHLQMWQMLSAGLGLGGAVAFINHLAIAYSWRLPLATSFIDDYWWWFVGLSGLVVVFISALAQGDYDADRAEEAEDENRRLVKVAAALRAGKNAAEEQSLADARENQELRAQLANVQASLAELGGTAQPEG